MNNNYSSCAVAMLAVAFTLALVAPAVAHQAGTIKVETIKSKTSGKLSTLPGYKKGDTKFQLLVTNKDPEVDVLLRFPVCQYGDENVEEQDWPYQYKRVQFSGSQTLDNYLSLGSGGVIGSPYPPRSPLYAFCIYSKSTVPGMYVLKRGQSVKLKATLDFRSPLLALAQDDPTRTRFGIAVRNFFDVFVLGSANDGYSDETAGALVSNRKAYAGALSEYAKSDAVPDARQRFSYFYQLTLDAPSSVSGVFERVSFKDLFMVNHDASWLATAPETEGIAVTQYTDGMEYVALEDYLTYKQTIPDFALDHDPQHSHLYAINDDLDGDGKSDTGGPRPGDQVCLLPPRHDCVLNDCRGGGTTGRMAGSGDQRAATYNLSGRFSSKWLDHALHPAFGWRAVAWWNDGGTWTKLASDWVQWDGSWSLAVNHTGYSGQHLRMQYRAYNSYYHPMDEDDDLFRWIGPDRTGISTSHDEGHWYADTDGGDANGLGELYHAAYYQWSKLYWTGEINPIRANPVKVYYPNTWYDCGDGSGVPWSCASASGSGTIWLTAAHGTQANVVQHEFAHNVNNEFWDNKRPAGSGGSHTLCGRFNEGLALREGYADFLPYWVQCDRSSDGSCTDGSGNNLESGNCTSSSNADEREWYVAKTFWDLYDSHSDIDDILWYNHEGSVQKLLFQNGPANDGDALGMSDFRTVYRNNCSAGHEGYIDDIFQMNGTN
ncbi:MAG: hypothetical protein H8E45_05835 [Proteobacteria bacterium]|nr:hypothetical protein [Pseudomonadota bacterium]